MTPQPLPQNLHPSQCYRLLDHKRDTLREGDEIQDESSTNGWWPIDPEFFGKEPEKGCTYRRPFTPPAPVQVQEFWRLLDKKETPQIGDQYFSGGHMRWFHHQENIGYHEQTPIRRRVTVPVAGPVPVADAVKSLKTFADQEASKIVNAIAGDPKPSGDYADYRERLFKYAEENFGHTLINSEMDEIEHIVLGFFKHKAPVADAPNWEMSSGRRARWILLEVGWEIQSSDQMYNKEEGWIIVTPDIVGFCHSDMMCPIRRSVSSFSEKDRQQPKSGPYLVSVDGHKAPTMEHATIEEARTEAERLARQEHPAQVRLLRQVAVARAEVTVKWEESK